MHRWIHTYIHTEYTHARMHARTRTRAHTHTHTHVYTDTHACIQTDTYGSHFIPIPAVHQIHGQHKLIKLLPLISIAKVPLNQ